MLVQMCRTSKRPWPLSSVVCGGGKCFQVEVGDVSLEGGLIVFDGEEVIRRFLLDQVTGGLGLRVQGIGSDHAAFDRERGEQGGSSGISLVFSPTARCATTMPS